MEFKVKHFVQEKKKWLKLYLTIFLSVLIVIVSSVFILDSVYQDRFYPGVKITGVNLKGLKKNSVEKIFTAKLEELSRQGQAFDYQNKTVRVYPVYISTSDPDLNQEIIDFNLEETVNKAYDLGRGEDFWNSLWQKIKYIFSKKKLALEPVIKTDEVEKILSENFEPQEKPGYNPQLNFQGQEIQITEGMRGLTFNYETAVQQMKRNLRQLKLEEIKLELELTLPDFEPAAANFLIPEAQVVLALAPITLTATSTNTYGQESKKTWQLDQNNLKKMLNLGWDKEAQKPQLIIDPVMVEEFIKPFRWQVEKPIQEAKFKIVNGRVNEFQASQTGYEINLALTVKNWENKIINKKQNLVELIIKEILPKNSTGSLNDLGIAEFLGVGRSNFSGSPVNRRHNIKVGAESLNGLLIQPQETFSLVEALGEINAAKGYLPELVIKGNKTVPEYGGGLCQIATTAFRLAINTGLPVTERQPHAYRVSYYEPAGTDATIYLPNPDLKFINDTPKNLLLQTRVEGDDLVFEFWGTSDGRQVATTTPNIWGLTAPAETKYIETADLPEGKIKCSESAHWGAETEFSRTITYEDDSTKEESWYSKYRPWQAVCLVGVDPAKLATSTDDIIN